MIELVPEMSRAENSPGAVLNLKHRKTRELHCIAGVVEQIAPRPGIPLNGRTTKAIVPRQVCDHRCQPASYQSPLAGKIARDDVGYRGYPLVVLGSQSPRHFMLHSIGKGAKGQKGADQYSQEQPGTEAHRSITRRVPSHSTDRGGAPFRTMADALVSINGNNRAPPGRKPPSRQGARDWR